MQEQPAVTKLTPAAALRSMRIVHLVLSGAIAMYIYSAQFVLRPTSEAADPVMVKGFVVLCIAGIVINFWVRKRQLGPAMEGIRRGDPTGLKRWQKVNIRSWVLALSVALFGFALRMTGGGTKVTLPFFLAGLALMWVWRPRLDDAAIPDINAQS